MFNEHYNFGRDDSSYFTSFLSLQFRSDDDSSVNIYNINVSLVSSISHIFMAPLFFLKKFSLLPKIFYLKIFYLYIITYEIVYYRFLGDSVATSSTTNPGSSSSIFDFFLSLHPDRYIFIFQITKLVFIRL